jgi:hypothetical protein
MSDFPGWRAIDAKMASVYGKQEPKHWAPLQRWSNGGSHPLDGVSAYRAEDPAHWHFVTYGLTELYKKTSKTEAESGWGFEFTMRVQRQQGEKSPPEWPYIFLQKLARYVFNTGNVFDDEHYIAWGGPVAPDEDTDMAAVVFMTDEALGQITTPHGKMKFLSSCCLRK